MSKPKKSADRTARAAAMMAEQNRKEKQRRLLTIVPVVVALLLVAGVAFWLQNEAGKSKGGPVPAGATSTFGMKLGEDSAAHDVVIYEDFLCPACKSFEAAMGEELNTAVAEGRATVEYRPINFLSNFGDYSERATNAFAVVLDAAGPDVAKTFHDELYAQQPVETGPYPDDAWLIEQAVEAGATESEVSDAIKDLKFKGWVADGVSAATDAKVQGTPTVLVDGEAIEAGKLPELLK